ncbi:hypothetical protein [Piscinibacter gummiphilus]|uniref:Uncharacterized protein n=1 Tax=Piscinibacter gummiphilus TaxID=946333 RepID=A0ABZ0CQ54_9BURK|nr:hypothetical protein [Piscinibacter gummiphilus]WOB06953.1 hypothetical protein RXV79_18745 [Piscinibacter gummiphilus]
MSPTYLPLLFLALAIALGFPSSASASGAGQVVSQMADVPPETKIKMLRVIFEDVFGTPEEIRTQFVAACNARNKAATPSTEKAQQIASSPAPKASDGSKSLSKEATLIAFCAPPVRRSIESALAPKAAASTPSASAPNPSIERTSPGKPGAASHVKR